MIALLAIPIIIIAILYFAFRCKHQWRCIDLWDDSLGKEKYYWHAHFCEYCLKRVHVLNADCAEFYKVK